MVCTFLAPNAPQGKRQVGIIQKNPTDAHPYTHFFIPNPMSTYIAPLALKVDEKTWGTTWRISSDRVIMHVSPEAPPTIPTWYRISEDGQAVTCLR